jgi:hypothetical protein
MRGCEQHEGQDHAEQTATWGGMHWIHSRTTECIDGIWGGSVAVWMAVSVEGKEIR